MASGDRGSAGAEAADAEAAGAEAASHWVRWHRSYEDPGSPLALRLRIVQSMVRAFLDSVPADHPRPIRVVSFCAGQGRDVIDVVSEHPRGGEVVALLVELDPELAAFARRRAADAGVHEQVRVVEGDASLCRHYEPAVPADLVLVCGVFGNIGRDDITRTIQALPGMCRQGAEVIWTRHRRPPDITPSIRAEFLDAGFEEVAFEDPGGYVLSVGRHRFTGAPSEPSDSSDSSEPSHSSEPSDSSGSSSRVAPFDPNAKLFEFVGDGSRPA